MNGHYVRRASDRALDNADVTVVMPAYNSARHIQEALSSVLRQTHREIAVHIHDDGSSDDTIRAAVEVADERCTITAGANRGPAGARNEIVAASRTRYIAMMDSDDISHPDRIRIQRRYLVEHPDIDVVSCAMHVLGDPSPPPAPRPETSHERILARLLQGSTINTGPAFGKRSLFAQVPMNAAYRAAEDYDLWCRMALAGARFHLVGDDLYGYRIHDTNTSRQANTHIGATTDTVKRRYHEATLEGPNAPRFSQWLVWASEEASAGITDVALMDSSLLMALGPGLGGVHSTFIQREELRAVAREMAVRQYVRRGGVASMGLIPLVRRELGWRPAAVGLKRALRHRPMALSRQGNLATVWPERRNDSSEQRPDHR